MDSQNTYGLSEGIFKACLFLGLKFPETVSKESTQEYMPSDYFGDNFELDSKMMSKLSIERKWTKDKLGKVYQNFSRVFNVQKCFPKRTKTDLNVYFCDFVLFAKQTGASNDDYFDFEFYKKSFAIRREFITCRYRDHISVICNDPCSLELEHDKAKTNIFFADFLHRDWIDTRRCTFDEFKSFVEKYPRSFSKLPTSLRGRGAEIISVASTENLEELLTNLKSDGRILEEIVIQHKSLQEFCPDSVNTVRVNTFLDIHNAVHILTTTGKFGRIGKIIDNVHMSGGCSVIIDPKTGIITSEGLSNLHEHMQKHPDTKKTFKGFQYPCWEKMRATVIKMAKMIPQMRHIGWDITINDQNEVVLIEINGKNPAAGFQQAADNTGRRHLYSPLLDEIQNYKQKEMQLLGYKINNLPDFESAYYATLPRSNLRLKYSMFTLIPNCESLMDVGCRKEKFVKSICPENVKYYPVDFQKHDEEVITCDFNKDKFLDIKVDTCLCAFTAEYVEHLPQFLADMCNAANKQILMWCRPIDKEIHAEWRWNHPFLTDFTEEFLIENMKQNNFQLNAQYTDPDNRSNILYDFRKSMLAKE